VAPDLELILADPEGSILCQYINEGTLSTKSASWMVEGIGEDFLPAISDFTRVKKAYAISDRESFLTARELLVTEGILAGSSTGTLLAAALRYCREQTEAKRVLTFAADTGNRYLSKMFNDFWMRDQGFIETDSHGDLRDLIARPYASRDTVTVGPGEPLANAYKRMKLYDVSQLPVIVDDQIVGIIDESDLLMAVAESSSRFDDPVNTAMVSELTEIDVQAPVAELMPIFERDFVAIVKDGSKFLGLITRVDLLNYLRRKADR
jgi:cystathionine beta-synthase